MGKRGPKPKGKVKIAWSSDFAYVIGLITTDGNLSPDGRHINLTSKDRDQIVAVKRILKLSNTVGRKARGGGGEKKYFVLQFGDILFYRFLLSIGLTPAKSKTLHTVDIPSKYFFDFLRGCLDGDGYTYSYWDKRWKSSFMFYLGFVSASKVFAEWLQNEIRQRLLVKGILKTVRKPKGDYYQLMYAKKEALLILKKMYQKRKATHLKRKRLKIERMLAIVGERI